MSKAPGKDQPEKFSDLLKTSWVKSSIVLGIFIAVVGLVIFLLLELFNFESTSLFADAKAFVGKYGLIGIFLATILAGTFVPLGSPGLVVAAAVFGVPKIPLILVTTTGFTIGLMINYGLAYGLGRPYVVKKVSAEKLEEVMHLWNKWGWILYTVFGLIPALPVELLSFVCGLLRTRISIFLVLSFLPRLIVFAIVAYFGEIVSNWI